MSNNVQISEEKVEELLGAMGKVSQALGSKLQHSGRKMSAGSERKKRLRGVQKDKKLARKEHRNAVKAYAKTLKTGDKALQRDALRKLKNSRLKSRQLRTGKKQKFRPQDFAKEPGNTKDTPQHLRHARKSSARAIYKRFGERYEQLQEVISRRSSHLAGAQVAATIGKNKMRKRTTADLGKKVASIRKKVAARNKENEGRFDAGYRDQANKQAALKRRAAKERSHNHAA